MVSANRIEIYKRAIESWGEEAQLNMVVEELSELIAAVQHFRRLHRWGHIASRVDVTDEVADVRLMLEQLQVMLRITDTDIAEVQEVKLKRLVALLDAESQVQS